MSFNGNKPIQKQNFTMAIFKNALVKRWKQKWIKMIAGILKGTLPVSSYEWKY